MATQQLDYRPDIEGLRAVAIALVVAAHYRVPGFEGGFVGVDVFFVLSGYLITRLLLRELASSGRIDLAAFYLRRLRRLLPALLLMLAVTAGLGFLILPVSEQAGQAESAKHAAVWISNFYFALAEFEYFSHGAERNLYLHTWSLGVEEQFYLIWPLLLLGLIGAKSHDARRVMSVLLVVGVASLGLCLYWTTASPQLAFYMMPARGWQFALGALMLVFAPARGAWLAWAGLATIALSALVIDGQRPYPGFWALLPSIGTAAVLSAGGGCRLLELRGVQSIGRVSYSWYLWHWPVLLLGAALLDADSSLARASLALLSLAVAWAAYRMVETPLRRSRVLLRRPAVLGAFTAMTIAVAMAATWKEEAVNYEQALRMTAYGKVKIDLPTIYQDGCDDWYHSAEVRPCVSGPSAGRIAVAIGDSVGMQWHPALAETFSSPEWQLITFTKSSCPIVSAPFFYERIGRDFTECSTWRDAAIARIVELRPEIVVIGSTDSYGFSEEQWVDGTAAILGRLSASAGRVVIIRSTPSIPFDGALCAIPYDRLGARYLNVRCRTNVDNPRGDDVFRWLQAAAARFNNVTLLDMNDHVCPAAQCSGTVGGITVFRDTQHLTASFVRTLTPVLSERLLVR